MLTVAVSSNETSDKSASDLVLFPFASSLPFQSEIYAVCTSNCAGGGAQLCILSSTVTRYGLTAQINTAGQKF